MWVRKYQVISGNMEYGIKAFQEWSGDGVEVAVGCADGVAITDTCGLGAADKGSGIGEGGKGDGSAVGAGEGRIDADGWFSSAASAAGSSGTVSGVFASECLTPSAAGVGSTSPLKVSASSDVADSPATAPAVTAVPPLVGNASQVKVTELAVASLKLTVNPAALAAASR